MKARAFLSSNMTGELDAERSSIRTLFQSEPFLREFIDLYVIEEHASPREIGRAFLEEVEDSQIVLVVLGSELREAVCKEFDHAEKHNKHIFCYCRQGIDCSEEMGEFIAGRAYKYHCGNYTDAADLVRRVKSDLRDDLARSHRRSLKEAQPSAETDAVAVYPIRSPNTIHSFFSHGEIQQLLNLEDYKNLNSDQLTLLGMIQIEERGAYSDGLLLLEAAILRNPEHCNALTNRGVVLLQMGLMRDAEFALKRAIQVSPDNAVALYNLGNCYSSVQCYDQAVECYERALSIEPEKNSAMSRLTAAYLYLGDATNALKWAVEAVQFENTGLNQYNHALALGLADDRDGAYRALAEADIDDLRRDEGRAFVAYHTESFDDVVQVVDNCIASSTPSILRVGMYKYRALLQLKRPSDAEEFFRFMESAYPMASSEYNNAGYEFQEAFGANEFVVWCFQQSVSMDNVQMPSWHNLQFALGSLERYEEVISACDSALKVEPLDSKSVNNKVESLKKLGRLQDAAVFLTEKTAAFTGQYDQVQSNALVDQLLDSPAGKLLGVLEKLQSNFHPKKE